MVFITKFEKVNIIGTRASQLANGAPPTIDITGMTDAIEIASKEYEQDKIPLILIRNYPDGTIQEIELKKGTSCPRDYL